MRSFRGGTPAGKSRSAGIWTDFPGLWFSLLLCLSLTGAASAQDASDCGSLENAFGPFDYTDPANRIGQRGESPLSLVERAHFTPKVERLVSGESASNPVDDLAYTLRVFPNHHRALHAMATYQLRHEPKRLGAYTIDCWFDRAIRFRSNDAKVHLVYGVYLAQVDRNEEALQQYKSALRYEPDLAEAHYNVGLLYVELEQYDSAYHHAVKAYGLGFPLPGLRTQLVRAGAWEEKEEKR